MALLEPANTGGDDAEAGFDPAMTGIDSLAGDDFSRLRNHPGTG